MTRPVTRFAKRLVAGLRREDGTATIEFVLAIPAVLMIFMASFESGLMMTRGMMVERSVDMTMRELRLGHMIMPTFAKLKADICSRT
ncbi:MAG: TadE family protein, partial [Paracoccaceae bacterium]